MRRVRVGPVDRLLAVMLVKIPLSNITPAVDRKARIVFAALAMLTVAVSAQVTATQNAGQKTESSSAPRIYAEVEGWLILQAMSSHICSATAEYQRGKLSLLWNPRKKNSGLFVYFPNYKSIKEGETYKIDVKFF